MPKRKTPILIRQGPFSGHYYALTSYSVKTWPDSRLRITAREGGKHDVTEEIEAILKVAVAKARIEEIEDIDQSRDVEEQPDGTIMCLSCTMILDNENDDCACNEIYRKRKQRIERLRKEAEGA